MDNEQTFDNNEELSTEANITTLPSSDFAAIQARHEAGEKLLDEDLDLIADTALDYLKHLLACFGETSVSIDEYEGDDGELILDVNDGDLAVLIGRHGRTLDALQAIVSSLVSKRLGFRYPIVVDIEGYKSRRKQKLQAIAYSAASRAKRQNGQVRLKPMNAYERRIVHLALVDDDEVTTHSEGEDPDRHIVITPLQT